MNPEGNAEGDARHARKMTVFLVLLLLLLLHALRGRLVRPHLSLLRSVCQGSKGVTINSSVSSTVDPYCYYCYYRCMRQYEVLQCATTRAYNA